jgi:hypothetical protein
MKLHLCLFLSLLIGSITNSISAIEQEDAAASMDNNKAESDVVIDLDAGTEEKSVEAETEKAGKEEGRVESDVSRMMQGRRRRKKKTLVTAMITSPNLMPTEISLFTRSYLTVVGDQVTGVTNLDEIEEAQDLGVDPIPAPVIERSFPRGQIEFATGSTPFNIDRNQGKNFGVIGSSFLQAGPIYNPDDVRFIDCSRQRNKDSCKIDPKLYDTSKKLQYGGGKQPNVRELAPPKDNFFFNGECTAVAGFGASQVLAHSCFYNLCLGGLGEDCVNIFAGGGFIFDPLQPVADGEEPLLPPSFPGAVIGGIGKYQGINGSVQIVTITTRTSAAQVGASPLVTGPSQPQTGYITQLIQLETTINLPPSKTLRSDVG